MEAVRVETLEGFADTFRAACGRQGPFLIEFRIQKWGEEKKVKETSQNSECACLRRSGFAEAGKADCGMEKTNSKIRR